MAIGACNTRLIFLIRSLIGILHVADVHHTLCGSLLYISHEYTYKYISLCVDEWMLPERASKIQN